MQPLDDINPEIYNYPPGITPLELIGAVAIVFVLAIGFQYIMDNKQITMNIMLKIGAIYLILRIAVLIVFKT